VPRIGDQHDNAERLEKLGVSSTIRPNRYRADRVARKLGSLLNSQVVRERCSFYRERMLDSTFELVADAIEPLVENHVG
jgi:UDP:flavonoid glycosyltransferase YjiC (YdhE family)